MDLNAESMRLERLSVPELQAEYAGLTGEAARSRHRGYLTRRMHRPDIDSKAIVS